jgi:hypothetical protein
MVIVRALLRRLECPEHGVRVQGVPFARYRAQFTRDFDDVAAFLATVPDEALTREYMRRLNARRARDRAGRKPKLKPCKFCRQKFGTVAMRVHIPSCEAKKKKGGK